MQVHHQRSEAGRPACRGPFKRGRGHRAPIAGIIARRIFQCPTETIRGEPAKILKQFVPRRALQNGISLRVPVTANVTILKNAPRNGVARWRQVTLNRRESNSSSRLWPTTSLHLHPNPGYAETAANTSMRGW